LMDHFCSAKIAETDCATSKAWYTLPRRPSGVELKNGTLSHGRLK